MLHSKQQRN
jgi:hypothetical protein